MAGLLPWPLEPFRSIACIPMKQGGKLAIWGFSKTKSFQRDLQPGGWKEARKERPGRLESRESQARDQRWS